MTFTIIILAQPKFMAERIYFRREYASRYYSWLPWSISAVLVEVPYSKLCPLKLFVFLHETNSLFLSIVLFYSAFFMFGLYWTSAMKNTSEAVAYFYLSFSTVVTWSATLGYIIASIAESPTVAGVL
jgi:hypothetical protein